MAHVHNSKNMASGMMKEMMAPGKMHAEMMKNMNHAGMMSGMMNHGMGKEAAKGSVKVVVATAGAKAKHGFFGRLVRNPVVWFGAGLAAGYYIHKYRKEINSCCQEE